MKRRLLLLLTFVVALSACGKSEKARQQLARLNVDYTESIHLTRELNIGEKTVARHPGEAMMVSCAPDHVFYFERATVCH